MEKIVEQAVLYDFYGELLTEHQRQVFGDVVLGDLSLSEAAEQYRISRQGIHDLVKRTDIQLRDYESKLHLIERFRTVRKEVLEIQKLCGEDKGDGNSSRIDGICRRILDEL